MLDKDVLKNRFISGYFMLVALKSAVKFSKCFLIVKFRTKFEVVQQKQFQSVIANHSWSDFSAVNWVAFSKEIRQVYST